MAGDEFLIQIVLRCSGTEVDTRVAMGTPQINTLSRKVHPDK